MPTPKVNIQFIDTIQPDIPDWINVDLAQQFDLVAYENDLFLTKQLLKQYKIIPNNTVTQASLLQNVQNMSFRSKQ